MAAMKPRGLGRGLDALLGGDEPAPAPAAGAPRSTLDVGLLRAGRFQPRTRFDEAALAELTESIRAQGVLQPVLVRPVEGGRYEIVAGERRWRAAKLAGLAEVPVIVRELDDRGALAAALIENLQREDLDPIEEAKGLERLVRELGLTHEQAAKAVGRSRAAVSNALRLLELAPPVQSLLHEGRLDMGHARALLALPVPRQLELGRVVADKGLSVRETERLVSRALQQAAAPRATAKKSRDQERFEQDLSDKLGTTVYVKAGRKGSGELVIRYSSLEHLDTLVEKLTR